MSRSGAAFNQVSACKMRIAIVVQTTAALLLLLLPSPVQVGTRKVTQHESQAQIYLSLKVAFIESLFYLCFGKKTQLLQFQLADFFESLWGVSRRL